MVEGREERKEELRTSQSFNVMKTTNSISGDCEGGHLLGKSSIHFVK